MILRSFFTVMLSVALSTPAWAGDINLSAVLSKIQVVRTEEKGGDELYISVTEYSSNSHPINYVVPDYPMHWLSKRLPDVKNVTLWADSLKEGEGAAIIFSLVEQDVPPWHMDDLVGTVKLKVRNERGKLKREWVLPHQKGHQVIQSHKNEFILKSEHAEYHVSLELKEHPTGTLEFMKEREHLIRLNPITGL